VQEGEMSFRSENAVFFGEIISLDVGYAVKVAGIFRFPNWQLNAGAAREGPSPGLFINVFCSSGILPLSAILRHDAAATLSVNNPASPNGVNFFVNNF
jgi:hypothetical protein